MDCNVSEIKAALPDVRWFQYPLRVEMDWNAGRHSRSPARRTEVSVPSAGRNGLELDDGHLAANPRQRGFSTLCGSKWIGTGRQPEHGHIHYTVFQYPLRVEMDWNSRICFSPTRYSCFSTLCGSKWIGTCWPSWNRTTGRGFSTLCGSKWIGTTERLADHRGNSQVSVPSAGRNGLEPQSTQRQIIPLECFSTLCGSKWIGTKRDIYLWTLNLIVSVPSAGRNGLELAADLITFYRSSKFQYPLRVEMDWNSTVSPRPCAICQGFRTLCGSKW